MGKYSFSLSPKVKGMVEWQLEHYHEDKRQLERYKKDLIPSATLAYSLEANGGGVGRSTENIAERILTNPYIIQTERSCEAISYVLKSLSDTDSKLIDLVYWKKSHSIMGAGLEVGLSKSSAYRHLDVILTSIARELGYIS